MADKPSYKELEKRIRVLEEECRVLEGSIEDLEELNTKAAKGEGKVRKGEVEWGGSEIVNTEH